jgi:apolipoprotein N-acyltransferase
VTFFGLLVSWIRLFGMPAYLALISTQTAWVVLALLVGRRLQGGAGRGESGGSPAEGWGVLAFPLAFLAGEYLRSHFPLGGFPWGGLGYSQHDHPALLRLAAYTGVWGLTLLVTTVNVLLARALLRLGGRPGSRPLESRPPKPRLLGAVGWLGAAAALALAPAALPAPEPDGASARLALVQGNAPQGDDFHADDLQVLRNHIRLTETLEPGSVSLVVWPEGSVEQDPFSNARFGAALEETIRGVRAPFMVGATLEAPGDRFRNTSLFLRPDASLAGRYEKIHLVPFGEYVPARALLEPLFQELQRVPRDGIPGQEHTVFSIPEGRFASIICYESTFPDLVRTFVNRGARLLVVSTNNSSYERSGASEQHLAFSQLRAAEHRMWVAHAALTGISGVVAPSGQVVARTGLFEPALLTPTVRFATERTIYARFGDWLPIGATAVVGGFFLLSIFSSRGSRPGPPGGRPGADTPGEQPGADVPGARSLIVIPTYNESENIGPLLAAVTASSPGSAVLVVDDASPDGTGRIVEDAASSNPRIHLLRREGVRGLGGAYVAGFGWGIERGYDRFVEMDADFSHDPADVPRLLAALDDHDLAIGSRYVPEGAIAGWSLGRRLLSAAGNRYARAWLGLPVRDSTSGFRAYRRGVLEAVFPVRSEGYAFQIEMAYRAWRAGFRIAELPIRFRDRSGGQSKLSRAVVVEALIRVPGWGIRDLVLGRRWRLRPGPETARGRRER